jgi:hypothetical protein
MTEQPSLELEYLFIIYTCKKNINNTVKMYDRYLSNKILFDCIKLEPLILYGDPNISTAYELIDNKILVVKCNDDYISLSSKTLNMMSVVNSLFPNIIGCFKCDDDILINIDSIIHFIKTSKIFSINYAGTTCILHSKENNNSHLIKKLDQLSKDLQINTPNVIYCGGPLYYLSKKALQIISDEPITDKLLNMVYEDVIIGHILNKHDIYPIHIQLYQDNIQMLNITRSCFHNTEKKYTLFLRIHGGLGNQLFQIASGYGISQKNNMNLIIINDSENKQSFTHIEDNNYLLNSIFMKFPNIKAYYLNLRGTKYLKEKDAACFTYQNIEENEDIVLDGYFQNEKYFINCKNRIIDMFLSNKIYIQCINNNPSSGEKFNQSYFIHVRRGDYLIHSKLYQIDYDKYYSRAIKHIRSKDSNAHFYIFSDDIEFCKTYGIFKHINHTFLLLPPLESLYYMSLCRKGGICCNSTFSWWGSYLNTNPYKIVTFPSKWINNNWKNDIYYSGSTVIQL